jgi:group II intron reverse transcriptase/maturase
MLNVEKHRTIQIQLPKEAQWAECSVSVADAGVPVISSDTVSRKWLSDCEKERALTVRHMERVADLANLEIACRRVISNKGSGGVDAMTVSELGNWFSGHWKELQQQLLSGSYRPQPVKTVVIPKPSGGQRMLGVPTVKDRLVQQAIHQVLSPRYERIFSQGSFGFRPGLSAHDALEKASGFVESGAHWLVDIDLEKFFDEVNHDRTMWLLSRRIGDKRLLKLIHSFLKAGMMTGGLVSQRTKGTPQGGPLSPLLSNIVLDELDKELELRGHRFVRYADDLRIFVESERAADRVMKSVTAYIETKLKLKVNRKKSRVCQGSETNFLGHSLLGGGRIGLSKESEERFKKTIKETTRRNRGISLEQLVSELNPKLRGWLNYFRYASMKKMIVETAGWIRRKLRCFRVKQCKRASGMFHFFGGLGLSKVKIWYIAGCRKGWWRKSATPPVHEAMNNQWFSRIGLYDLLDNFNRYKLEETAVYESTYGGVRGR